MSEGSRTASRIGADEPCPCGSGGVFSSCCEPVIQRRRAAVTAEELMRSRYTAYVIEDARWLLDSWHEDTRPAELRLEAVDWKRLRIVSSSHDVVEFIATYKSSGRAFKLHEKSRFLQSGGEWFYLDGV